MSRAEPSTWLGPVLMLVGLACEEAPTTREYSNIGSFCLAPGEAGTAFLSVSIGVGPDDPCLSSCSDLVASCSATLVDGRVQVQSQLVETEGPPWDCPTACANAGARCELTLPAPGDYRFVFNGGRSTTATLPPAAAVPLFGDHACSP